MRHWGIGVFLGVSAAVSGCKSGAKAEEKVEVSLLPECRNNCVSEYGEPLGVHNKVAAFSNCQPGCIDPTPHHVPASETGLADDTYTGISWQCVEYARRWWLLNLGIVFGSVDTADAMWTQVKTAQHLASRGERVVERHENGGSVAPMPGDLIVYEAVPQSQDLKFGHVAVVVGIDAKHSFVEIAEQNFSNAVWENSERYSRRLRLRTMSGRYTLVDTATSLNTETQIYGWLRPQHQ